MKKTKCNTVEFVYNEFQGIRKTDGSIAHPIMFYCRD